jgi:putative transposase
MSSVGSCTDNTAMGSFFALLKRKRINRRKYRTRVKARTNFFDYLERFHNPRRRHQLEVIKRNDLLFAPPSVETG